MTNALSGLEKVLLFMLEMVVLNIEQILTWDGDEQPACILTAPTPAHTAEESKGTSITESHVRVHLQAQLYRNIIGGIALD